MAVTWGYITAQMTKIQENLFGSLTNLRTVSFLFVYALSNESVWVLL